MAHRVELAPAAQRQLGRLRGATLLAIRGVILGLGDDPRPPGSVKLIDSDNIWRVRVRLDGDPWRIVYQVRSADLLVIVLRVVRRNEGTYRGL